MMVTTHILAEGFTTVAVDEKIELARWSAGNALLIGALLSAAALYAVAWMYRRESRGNVSRGLRWMLVSCRVLVLMGLGLIGLEPVLVKYVHRQLSGHTLVLVDESASMSLADHYRLPDDRQHAQRLIEEIPKAGLVRASLCERILSHDNKRWLKSLAAKNDVKLFTFDDGLRLRRLFTRHSERPFAGSDADSQNTEKMHANQGDLGNTVASSRGGLIRLDPKGPATDIGHAIREAIDSLSGEPVAGVILLTDGGFNRGESTEALGRFLKQKHVGLFAIGIGDAAEPINVQLAQIQAPHTVFKNDPFSITVRVNAQGTADQDIEIELLERRGATDREADSPEKVVASRTVHPDARGVIEPVVFDRKVAEPGVVSYAARVSPLPFEAVTSDNRREILPAVRILDDKMRVLLIAGSPSYDYRFLARMLERDATVDLSTWLQSADIHSVRDGNTIITELPTTAEAIDAYDAILLMDCDPGEFDPTWSSTVATFVSDHAGGLLYEAGNKFAGHLFRSAKMTSIVEMLPIVPDPEAEIVINELGHYQMKAWPILIPDEATDNPILQLSDHPSETKAIWALLGRVYWHYPVRREKPVAQALMRHSNPRMVNSFGPHVLFATQYVGTGRSAYLGINSTWRWRRSDERYFNRFWIQTLRFLVEGKLLGGRSRDQIITDREQFELGESVVVRARALDEHFNPLMMPELTLEITSSVGLEKDTATPEKTNEAVSLSPILGRDGYYEGRFVPKHVGAFQLSLNLPGETSTDSSANPDAATKEIRVSQPNIEMQHTAMDRAGLTAFAKAAAGDSRFFEADQVDDVPKIIQDRSRTTVVRGRPKALWDRPSLFAVLMLLLTLEWILRKRAKLL